MWTDGCPAYNRLKHSFRHTTVNHKKEFTAHEGTTTNSVEGFWHLMKRFVRQRWSKLSGSHINVKGKFYFASFFFDCRFRNVDPLSAFFTRIRSFSGEEWPTLHPLPQECLSALSGVENTLEFFM